MAGLFLGIDTSNYKTSLAVVDENKNIVFNKSEYLDVKQGERGLRQSEAFFKQSNNLPAFIKSVFSYVDPDDISGIGVSTRPRRLDGSYMPCFLAGYNLAQELGSTLDIPIYEFSHQEGHAAAIIDSCGISPGKVNLLYHLSGGTTELLLCSEDDMGYEMKIVGGTKDISCGQLLDRIGVELGYSFPSGMYLDKIALENNERTNIVPHIRHEDGYFNLSGIETKLIRYIQNQPSDSEINSMISALFKEIAAILNKTIEFIRTTNNIDRIYIAGGVASSESVRNHLIDCDYVFGSPALSGDNAIGVALLANKLHNRG